ncbi:MAG TPA: hypothetical protein VNO26_15630 [Candidatus Limnocylindria bacterium]|nr:hypothetical protein [Candidatus Limnocylindria bacterium]
MNARGGILLALLVCQGCLVDARLDDQGVNRDPPPGRAGPA